MKKVFKEIMQWGLALICSILVLNCLTFSFYHPTHELKRNGGATPGLRYPHMYGLYGTEGFGIQTVDSNGYINPDLPREESYYCIIGSSHTEGFHVGKNERYSDILNQKFGYTDTLKFYNIAHSGFYYTGIVNRFDGMVMEFPNMQGLIIELLKTDYSPTALEDALNQKGFSEEDTIAGLTSKLTVKDKCIISFKNYFPFFRVLTSQLETYKKCAVEGTASEDNKDDFDIDAYREALSKTMDLLRKEYSGPIVIVYHPVTSLDSDGGLVVSESITDSVFEEECLKHEIGFINMKDSFERDYYENHEAAYGFWNTTMMTGHINDRCHELIANELYDYFLDMGLN